MNSLLSEELKSAFQDGLDRYNRYVLCAHTSPDGDAVGSTVALWHYLKDCGKQASVVLPTRFPDFLEWIPGADQVVLFEKEPDLAKQLIDEAEVICCLDISELSRMDPSMAEVVEKASAEKWQIDHHLNPSGFAKLAMSFPEMSSTCELVFRFIYELGGYNQISLEAAQAIYAGMCTDTGGFTYNSTRPEVYQIIGMLLEKGIDKDKIYRQIYNNSTYDKVRLQGYVLNEKLVYFEPFRACLFTLTREEQQRYHFQKGDAEGLVNIPLTIKGVRLSCSLREDPEEEGKVLVSLRSVDEFPCNIMSQMFFNGGGHLNAAGGRLYCSMEEAVSIFKQALIQFESQLLGQK